jgi:hypothetical protein
VEELDRILDADDVLGVARVDAADEGGELLPLPAAPATTTRPRSCSASARAADGRPSSSNVGTLSGMLRMTIASDPRWR